MAGLVVASAMATIGLALTFLVFPAGYLSDRMGRKPLNLAGGLLMALGVFLLLLATLSVLAGTALLLRVSGRRSGPKQRTERGSRFSVLSSLFRSIADSP
ncbi:MAG TPA: hypothetical protein EYP55_05010 [Anaerolineae bacterium]|nr:hypothetical protein [Anaerolineae bacterium]